MGGRMGELHAGGDGVRSKMGEWQRGIGERWWGRMGVWDERGLEMRRQNRLM